MEAEIKSLKGENDEIKKLIQQLSFSLDSVSHVSKVFWDFENVYFTPENFVSFAAQLQELMKRWYQRELGLLSAQNQDHLESRKKADESFSKLNWKFMIVAVGTIYDSNGGRANRALHLSDAMQVVLAAMGFPILQVSFTFSLKLICRYAFYLYFMIILHFVHSFIHYLYIFQIFKQVPDLKKKEQAV